jgi:hypothetical protein
MNTEKVNIANAASGIYQLTVTSTAGQSSLKVIKQ